MLNEPNNGSVGYGTVTYGTVKFDLDFLHGSALMFNVLMSSSIIHAVMHTFQMVPFQMADFDDEILHSVQSYSYSDSWTSYLSGL